MRVDRVVFARRTRSGGAVAGLSRRQGWATVAGALAVLLMLASCGAAGSPGGSGSRGGASAVPPGSSGSDAGAGTSAAGQALGDRLAGRTFLVTAVGHQLVAGSTVRIEFTDGQVNWNAGCNTMGGAARWDGSVLSVDQVMGTEMGCAAPLMAQDTWMTALLQAGLRADLTGDVLTLTGEEVELRLTDRRVADPDRPLQGTTWHLDGIIEGNAASSVPQGIAATLRISGGRIHFFDGLNDYDGPLGSDAKLIVGPDIVRIHGQIAGSGVGCASGHTCSVDMSLLTADFGYRITANHLTVTGIGATTGRGLTFVTDDEAGATAGDTGEPGGAPTPTVAPPPSTPGQIGAPTTAAGPPAAPDTSWEGPVPAKSAPIVSPGSMVPLPTAVGPRAPVPGRHDSIPPQPSPKAADTPAG